MNEDEEKMMIGMVLFGTILNRLYLCDSLERF